MEGTGLSVVMMTSSNGNIFRVTGPLCGDFTGHRGDFIGHRWIPLKEASDAARALMLSLICAGINAWVNNRKAGDSRRHRAHYDVIVILHNHYNGCCWSVDARGYGINCYLIFPEYLEGHKLKTSIPAFIWMHTLMVHGVIYILVKCNGWIRFILLCFQTPWTLRTWS